MLAVEIASILTWVRIFRARVSGGNIATLQRFTQILLVTAPLCLLLIMPFYVWSVGISSPPLLAVVLSAHANGGVGTW